MYPRFSASQISKWYADKDNILATQKLGYGGCRNVLKTSRVHYPEQETELYLRFVYRRKHLGLKTTDLWLQLVMQELLTAHKPTGYEHFKYSNGWVSGFKNRYRITYQTRTNKKKLPLAERLHRIKTFHKWLLHTLQRSGPIRCVKYGRFPADHIFHQDQIPLPFVLHSDRTLNQVGEPVFIFQPNGSGLDKRQATIQLCIRAEGDQCVRIALIFRGEGKRLKSEEKATYRALSDLLQVYFQPKAWADEAVMLPWLDQFIQETAHLPYERMLGMDRHGPQQTTRFKQKMDNAQVQGVYTPADCTDMVAPCDHHVGARLKHIVSAFYHAELEEHRDDWCNPPTQGGLKAWQRRVKMATWVACAWSILKEDSQFLRSAFVSTGFLIARDGSEDHLIKLAGVPDYSFQ